MTKIRSIPHLISTMTLMIKQIRKNRTRKMMMMTTLMMTKMTTKNITKMKTTNIMKMMITTMQMMTTMIIERKKIVYIIKRLWTMIV